MTGRVSRKDGVLLAILLCWVAALYGPGLSGPFLFDDVPNILDNASLVGAKTRLLDWWSAAQSSGAGPLRRPVSMLSFALQLGDTQPSSALGLKTANLLIHLACGTLIYFVSLLTLRAMGTSVEGRYTHLPILTAALWLMSPLFASTVLYPIQRMAQLSTLFVLAGLLSYCCYRVAWARRGARLDEFLALGLWLTLFTVLAVYSKENGILLPWFVALFECFLIQGFWAGRHSMRVQRLATVAAVLPLVAGTVFVFWQWDWLIHGYEYRDFTLAERLWTESRLLWRYLSWFFLPQPGELGLFHDDITVSKDWWTPRTSALAVIGWCMALWIGYLVRRSFPWLLFAVLFFLVGHSFESGILPLELVFEHRNYLPMIGPAMLLAASLSWLLEKLRKTSGLFVAWAPTALFCLLFSATLMFRASIWDTDLSLASASYGRHPQSQRSAHLYASTLLRHRNQGLVVDEEAIEYLTVARHEFERLHLANPSDLSALVMLYTIDSSYVTETSTPERWLQGIEDSVSVLKLKASEYAAMRVLVRCVTDGGCKPPSDRLEHIVKVFSDRFPNRYGGTQLRLQLLDSEDGSPDARISLLDSAVKASPGQLSLYYPLISSWLDLGNYAAAHLVFIELIKADESYRHLSGIDRMFSGESS